MEAIRVHKFGGAALRDGAAVRRAVEIVQDRGTPPPLVVVSAHEGVTDLLLAAAEGAARGSYDADGLRIRHRSILRQLDLPSELLDRHLIQLRAVLESVRSDRRLDRRRRDFVLSFGERMSARVVAAALRSSGLAATPVDAFDLGLLSETRSGLTRPLAGAQDAVRRAVMEVPGIPVVTGFVALDAEGHVTTLGRDGSDLTAVWIGAAVGAQEVHLWKTVDGIHTADPDVVPGARRLEHLDYDQAAELALHGAGVLHRAAAEPARRSGLAIRVRSVLDPEGGGTRVDERGPTETLALAHRSRVALVTHRLDLGREPGEQMTRRFAACRDAGLEPYLSTVSGTDAVLLLPDAPGPSPGPLAGPSEGGQLERGLASLALVGGRVGADPEVAARAVDLARRAGIELRTLPSGDGSLSRLFLAASTEVEPALRLLHGAFVEAPQTLRSPGRPADRA